MQLLWAPSGHGTLRMTISYWDYVPKNIWGSWKSSIVSKTIRASHDIFYEFLYDYIPQGSRSNPRRRNRFHDRPSAAENNHLYPSIAPLGSSAPEVASALSDARNLGINEVAKIDNLIIVSDLSEPAVENINSGIMDSSFQALLLSGIFLHSRTPIPAFLSRTLPPARTPCMAIWLLQTQLHQLMINILNTSLLIKAKVHNPIFIMAF